MVNFFFAFQDGNHTILVVFIDFDLTHPELYNLGFLLLLSHYATVNAGLFVIAPMPLRVYAA